jgi:hypothetical protein
VFVANFDRTTGREKRHERWLEHGKGKKHKKGHPKEGKAIRIGDVTGGSIMAGLRKRRDQPAEEAHGQPQSVPVTGRG